MGRTIRVAVTGLFVALALGPIAVLASHQFADVPDSNLYHNDIDALVDSGVTSGCGGGNYCPSANVTREQMAAFLNRLGALAPGKTPVVNADRLDGLDSTQFVRSDVEVLRHASCGGPLMVPIDPSITWGTVSGATYATSGTSSTFRCQLVFPDGATITGISYGLHDFSATEYVGCELHRSFVRSYGDAKVGTGWATTAATQPGNVNLEEVLDEPADNFAYIYYVQCTITGTGSDISIRGHTASYTLTGAP